jgi:(4S)-4-hydroxy-5-phosphonooxypentane-2,3-dione isomerase
MSGFVITVDFTVKPGAMAAFRKLIDKNAQESCADEPGCRRFDVLVPTELGDRVFLYEIYDDRAAFDAHLKTRHFDVFNRESAGFVISKKVIEYNLACEGSQGR